MPELLLPESSVLRRAAALIGLLVFLSAAVRPAQAQSLLASPSSLSFGATAGGSNPSAQTVNVQVVGLLESLLGWAVTTSTSSGGNWLAVSPSSGTSNGTLSVSANIAGLSAGTYTGAVQISLLSLVTLVDVQVSLTVTAPPSISAAAAPLSFSATAGGSNPSAGELSISNSGGGTLNWTAAASTASGGNWLSIAPASGTNSGTVTVSASAAGLSTGTYNGSIQIAATGAANSPQAIPVSLTVIAPPSISVALVPLSFTATQGAGNPSAQSIAISNSSAGSLNWTAAASTSSGGNWLSTSPASGTNSGTVTVLASTAGLSTGTYSGSIQIAASGASNTPQTISVSLTVTSSAVSSISAIPAALSFAATQGAGNPSAQSIAISNSGAGSLNWTAAASTASGGNWLSIAPASGTNSGTVTVLASTAGLSTGTYSGSIQIAASGASNTPQTISVSLTVTSSAVSSISATPAALSFTATQGAGNPSAQSIAISNFGSGSLNWTAAASTSSGGNWLSTSPASGTNSGTVTVSANVAALSAGTYVGAIQIAASGTTSSSQSVAVILTVSAPACTYALSSSSQSFSASGGSTTVTVTAPAGCNWTATSNASFLTVASGTNGSGNGTVALSAAPNSGTPVLSGTVSIAGLVFSAVEAGSTTLPSLGISPSSISVSMSAGSSSTVRSIQISTSSGSFAWSVAAQAFGGPAGWLTVSPGSGTATAAQPSAVSVALEPSGLQPGIYQGQITVQNSSGAAAGSVYVTLDITSSAAPQLLLSQSSFVFSVQQGGGVPPAQTLQVVNAGQGSLDWTISAPNSPAFDAPSPSSGVAAARGSGSSITLGVNPAGLAPGVYQNLFEVSAPGAADGVQSVLVTLQVVSPNAPSSGQLFPGGMIFTASQGGAAPAAEALAINNAGGGTLSFALQAATMSGGNWLSISPTSGTAGPGPAAAQVAVSTANLPAGTYQGVVMAQFDGGAAQQEQVLLVVTPSGVSGGAEQPDRAVSGAGLSRADTTDESASCQPAGMDLVVTSISDGISLPVSFPQTLLAEVVDNCGNPVNTASVVVSVDALNIVLLSVGNGFYSGSWTPESQSSAISVVFLAVDPLLGTAEASYTVSTNPAAGGESLPAVLPAGVVGAAAFPPQAPLAPGSIIAIFGSSLANAQEGASAVPLPLSLDGTSVQIGGVAAPLYYVSSGQINAQVPFEAAAGQKLSIVVTTNGQRAAPQNYLIAPVQPAIFMAGTIGAVQNSNGNITPSNPAHLGDVLVIYANALGVTNPEVGTGQPSPAAQVVIPTMVTVGGVAVPVEYQGLTPTLVGENQINVQLTGNVPAGDNVPVVVTQNGVPSNTAYITIE